MGVGVGVGGIGLGVAVGGTGVAVAVGGSGLDVAVSGGDVAAGAPHPTKDRVTQITPMICCRDGRLKLLLFPGNFPKPMASWLNHNKGIV
jgi:hypothetical protein